MDVELKHLMRFSVVYRFIRKLDISDTSVKAYFTFVSYNLFQEETSSWAERDPPGEGCFLFFSQSIRGKCKIAQL